MLPRKNAEQSAWQGSFAFLAGSLPPTSDRTLTAGQIVSNRIVKMAEHELIDHLKIISYEDRYAQDFRGQIFFALEKDVVLGTCAAISHSSEIIEIAKLTVVPSARQRGIGRVLAQTVIDYARSMGAKKVLLLSSTRLKSALRLYESIGFLGAPLPEEPDYASADVYMELALSRPDPSSSY